MNLEARIARLESLQSINDTPPLIIEHIVTPGARSGPLKTLRPYDGGISYTREDGESEEAFIDRAAATEGYPGKGVSLIGESEEEA